MSLESFGNNMLALLIVLAFVFMIYVKVTKKTFKEAFEGIASLVGGKDK